MKKILMICILLLSFNSLAASYKYSMVCFDTSMKIWNWNWRNKALDNLDWYKSHKIVVENIGDKTTVELHGKKASIRKWYNPLNYVGTTAVNPMANRIKYTKIKKHEVAQWDGGADFIKALASGNIYNTSLFQDIDQDLQIEVVHDGDTGFHFELFEEEFVWNEGVDIINLNVTFKGKTLGLLNRCLFKKEPLK